MVRITLRLEDEVHEKLRWLAFKERRSQHAIIMELLEARVADVQPPKEDDEP
jgi:predicted transcriptional regulator